MTKQIVKPTKWENLTDEQREEIKAFYSEWELSELERGTWDKIEEKLLGDKTHTAWAVNFGTKLHLH